MKKIKGSIRQYSTKQTNEQIYKWTWFDRLSNVIDIFMYASGIGTIIYIIYLLIK